MDEINISLGGSSKPNKSSSRNRGSNAQPKSNLTLEQRIEIEKTFFKINFYFGGCLETEIGKVIPRLIEQFKDKDDMEMDMDMGDMAGMVKITRTNTQSF
jgi:hypothetical protein